MYCGIADVLDVCRTYSWDIDNQIIPDDRILSIIEDATSLTNSVIEPRYKSADFINGVPFVVKKYCAVLSAYLLMTRYGHVHTGNLERNLLSLKQSLNFYLSILARGSVFSGGDKLSPAVEAQSTLQTTKVLEGIRDGWRFPPDFVRGCRENKKNYG